MSTAKDRAASLRKRDAPAEPEPEVKPEAPADTATTVRQTVDITTRRHAQFAAWRMETALALGRNRLSVQDALAALVDAVLFDETVARHVRVQLERPEAEGS